jgi:hypothetical protein
MLPEETYTNNDKINEDKDRKINMDEYITDLVLISLASIKYFINAVSRPNVYIIPRKKEID